MTQKNVDKIKDKISKLLAKANGTSSAEEASAFMAKVQDLLTKHQLEIGDIVAKDPMERTVLFVVPKSPKPWHRTIPNIVGEYYGCKVIAIFRREATWMTAVGRESTRVAAEMMLPFLVGQLREQAIEYQKKTLYSRNKAMQDVCDAFAIRLKKLIEARAPKADGTGDGRSLMLLDEAEAALKEMFPEMEESKPRKLEHNPLAKEHADKISLNDQLSGGNSAPAEIAKPALALGHG